MRSDWARWHARSSRPAWPRRWIASDSTVCWHCGVQRTGAYVRVDQRRVPFYTRGRELRARMTRDSGSAEAGAWVLRVRRWGAALRDVVPPISIKTRDGHAKIHHGAGRHFPGADL